MSKNPLAEVFGFPIGNQSEEAKRCRRLRLCPFNNKVPSCTKDKANAPLAVCSVFDGKDIAITCPIRFREDWRIAEDAAGFFFPTNVSWTSLTEVRLNDRDGRSAGNIDLVLVSYDEHGRVIEFGALEVQAVYISGNVRRPFEHYMENAANATTFDWSGEPNYPNPDYLSSSRKRLVPQLIYKGGILNDWGKKMAVAVHTAFFETLPSLPEVEPQDADVAWMVYDLVHDAQCNRFKLSRSKIVYTKFRSALDRITTPQRGDVTNFIQYLQEKLDEKLDGGNPPDAPVLTDIKGF